MRGPACERKVISSAVFDHAVRPAGSRFSMLTWLRVTGTPTSTEIDTPSPLRDELKVRSLLDDPGLRRAMCLDAPHTELEPMVMRRGPASSSGWLDRRRLLEIATV